MVIIFVPLRGWVIYSCIISIVIQGHVLDPGNIGHVRVSHGRLGAGLKEVIGETASMRVTLWRMTFSLSSLVTCTSFE